jgi:hypothetical protein
MNGCFECPFPRPIVHLYSLHNEVMSSVGYSYTMNSYTMKL